LISSFLSNNISCNLPLFLTIYLPHTKEESRPKGRLPRQKKKHLVKRAKTALTAVFVFNYVRSSVKRIYGRILNAYFMLFISG